MDKELRTGGVADKWARLAAQRREGDRVVTFASPPTFWQALAGRAGYALVRDGEIVVHVVTMTN